MTKKNEFLENEIDLIPVFKVLVNSKKLIIITTLVCTFLAFIYTYQKDAAYESTALLEIGSYVSINNQEKLIESAPDLIEDLKVEINYKKKLAVEFKEIRDRIISLSYISSSPNINTKILNSTIEYILNKHSVGLTKKIKLLKNQNKIIDTKINFLNNSLETQKNITIQNTYRSIEKEEAKINFIKSALKKEVEAKKTLNSELLTNLIIRIPAREDQLNLLKTIISQEERNFEALKNNSELSLIRASQEPSIESVIYSYKSDVIKHRAEIQNLLEQKNNIEIELGFLNSENFELESEELLEAIQAKEYLEAKMELLKKSNFEFKSEELLEVTQEKGVVKVELLDGKTFEFDEFFSLKQEKERLKSEIALLTSQAQRETQLINQITSSKIEKNALIITIFGAILGFIFSIFIVLSKEYILLNLKHQDSLQ